MADEITVSMSIRAEKDGLSVFRNHGPLQFDWATPRGFNPGVVNIGTSEEAISFGDVTPGWVIMKNLDGTNYVIWGPESGGNMVACGRLSPGMVALLRLAPGVTLRMQANTAACDVLIEAINT
jgi:hypothetical protein